MKALITLDYQGMELTASRDAWFNATEIAEAHNKRLDNFFSLQRTQKYIKTIAKQKNLIPLNRRELEKPFAVADYPDLIQTKRGRRSSGTWVHPDLMVCFARFISLDFEIWCDKTIKALLIDGQNWQTARAESKLGFQVMAEIIQASRQADGKDCKAHHFSNEALLCNAALTGQFRAIQRDNLNGAALTMLARLEARNAALIAQSMPYQQRKAQLFDMAAPIRSSFQTALSGGDAA